MTGKDESNLQSRTYGAYGESAVSPHARSSYTGEVAEAETGWYLLGGRPYSPVLRRFLTPDPSSPFDEGGFNRHAYCSGDPVNRIDPTGESWMDWLAAGVTLAISVVATVATAGAASTALLPAGMAAVTGLKAGAGFASAASASMTVALATPGIQLAMTAGMANVVDVWAQVGSMVARGTGSQKAQEILGWMHFATSLGMSAVTTAMFSGKPASSSSTFAAGRNSTAASATAGATASYRDARIPPTRPMITSGAAEGRASSLSMESTAVVMQPDTALSRSELARLAGDAKKAGADQLAVYTGSRHMPRRGEHLPGDDESRRSPRLDLAGEAGRLGGSAGLDMTVSDRVQTTPGKLQRELSWRGVHLIPLSPVLDAAVAVRLGFETTASRHLSLRAGR